MTSAKVSPDSASPTARTADVSNSAAVWNSRSVMAVSAFAFTSLTSAALLFSVQPLIAKALLPLLGGTPAVWVTCMAFFQAALLIGYLYVHFATRWLGVRYQAILHVALLVASLAALPIALPQGWVPPEGTSPILWITGALAVLVGAPFVILSATAPMLQKWYSHTGYSGAEDPYFLYVPSNIGSLVALGSYPFLIEPNLGLATQAGVWSSGYLLFAALIAVCAAILWRTYVPVSATEAPAVMRPVDEVELPAASNALRLRWVALSFAPSSLLLGVTTYLTTDVAAVPLFWVVPLALYLLTFILVFARRQILPHAAMVTIFPFVVLPLVVVMLWGSIGSAWLTIALHIVAFFVAAMVCHGELVRARPRAGDLTEFYLWMSVGGLAGGIFNAILAPLVFPLILEYPIAIILVSLMRPSVDRTDSPQLRTMDLVLPVAVGAAVIWAIVWNDFASDNVGSTLLTIAFALVGVAWASRQVRFGLWIAVLLIAGPLYDSRNKDISFRDRSFFGVSSIIEYPSGWRDFMHGSTLHGTQHLGSEDELAPTSYYTWSGPFGDVADAYLTDERPQQVAAIGLGVGTIACYGEAGDTFHFLEIDPVVIDVADRYFTYLSDCPPEVNVRLGDGRLLLNDLPAASLDLIVSDAFSSDAIPVHLLTREAVLLYLSKLKPDGAIAIHITNRYVDLEPVLAELAAELRLTALVRGDDYRSDEDIDLYDKRTSVWVVLSRSDETAPLSDYADWRPARATPGISYWTDDFSNIASILN